MWHKGVRTTSPDSLNICSGSRVNVLINGPSSRKKRQPRGRNGNHFSTIPGQEEREAKELHPSLTKVHCKYETLLQCLSTVQHMNCEPVTVQLAGRETRREVCGTWKQAGPEAKLEPRWLDRMRDFHHRIQTLAQQQPTLNSCHQLAGRPMQIWHRLQQYKTH